MAMGVDRRSWWLVVAGLAAVLVAALGWWLWLSRNAPPEPLARQYLDFTACLLTDDRGVTGPDGAARFPQARFYVVGLRTSAPNVSTIDGSGLAEVRASVSRVVTAAVAASPRR